MNFAWSPLVPPAEHSSSPSLQRTADAAAFLLFAAGILQTLFGLVDGWAAFVPLAASLLLFGLPHGAIDHLVVLGLTGRRLRPAPLAAIVTAYLALALAVICLWKVAPVFALVAFLGVTAFHWGRADVQFNRCLHPRGLPPATGMIDTALRGAVPMIVPFLAFPAATEAFAAASQRLFTEDRPIDFAHLQLTLGLTLATLWTAHVLVHRRAFFQRSATADRRWLIESAALTGFFALVPPVAAIGWYFCWWHGLRHVLRLCRYEAPGSPAPPQLRTQLRRFFLQAIPATVAAIALLATLLSLLPVGRTAGLDWIAVYLVFISSLTVPHLLVVEWMDRREFRHLAIESVQGSVNP